MIKKLLHGNLPFRVFFFHTLLACTVYSLAQPVIFENKGICGGGATTQPSISPFNDQVYFVTSDMSPVFKTVNAGTEWNQIPYYELTGAGQHTKVEFTADSNILYSFGYTGYPNPYQAKKSIDGGATWNVLASAPANGYVYQLYADPNSTDRVILCDYTTVYISTDGGSSFTTAFTTTANSIYIGGVFWDGNDIYVAANSGGSGGSALLWVSNDNGITFNSEPINGDFPATHFFRYMEGVKVNGQVKLYAVSMYSTFGGLNFTEYWGPNREVLRLEYGTSNWQSLDGNGLNLAVSGGSVHPNLIATCTSDPDVIYLGCYEAPAMEVYKSIDAGNSWMQILDCENFNLNQNVNTGWLGAGANTYNWWWSGPVIGLDVANGNSDVVVITDYMSSHHTRDGGASWNALYVAPSELNPMGSNTPSDLPYESNGLEITSCWDLHWMSSLDVFASYTDIQGFISHDAGNTWSTGYNYPSSYNTTYTVIPSPDGSKIYACVSDKHDMYGSIYLSDALIDQGIGEIFESSDNGMNWTVTHDFQRVVLDMAIDENNPNRFYACIANSSDGGIYYSADFGASWNLLPAPPRTEGHPIEIEVLSDGTLVAVFSARYDNGEFTASSGVFISVDNGQSWVDRSDIGMHYWTMDVEIAPDNDSIWYASVKSHWGPNNIEQGGLYKSSDRGSNWTRIKSFYRVWSTTLHPTNPDVAYVCTHDNQEGLQYTENLTSSNPTFERVNSYHYSNPIRVIFNPYNTDQVWVTSFGNGLKKGVVSNLNNEENVATNEIFIYPNPVLDELTIDFVTEQLKADIVMTNQLGQIVSEASVRHIRKHTMKITVQPGIYYMQITLSDGKRSILKFIKQ